MRNEILGKAFRSPKPPLFAAPGSPSPFLVLPSHSALTDELMMMQVPYYSSSTESVVLYRSVLVCIQYVVCLVDAET